MINFFKTTPDKNILQLKSSTIVCFKVRKWRFNTIKPEFSAKVYQKNLEKFIVKVIMVSDMKINIDNNINVQNLAGSLQASKNKNIKTLKTDSLLATVKVRYAKIIEKAQNGEDVDPKAVEHAKKLLASGELDSPEGAKQAARNLLLYGI